MMAKLFKPTVVKRVRFDRIMYWNVEGNTPAYLPTKIKRVGVKPIEKVNTSSKPIWISDHFGLFAVFNWQ